MDDNFRHSDSITWPVSMAFNPYFEFDSGFGVGASIGPIALFFLKDSSGSDRFSYIIPIGADVRYTFLRDGNLSPYLRAGLRYPIAGGDDLSGSQVGPFGAAGIEFLRTKIVGFGLELGYNFSKVEVGAGPSGGEKDVTVTNTQ